MKVAHAARQSEPPCAKGCGRLADVLSVLLAGVGALAADPFPPVVQEISLDRGWNLVSLQVGDASGFHVDGLTNAVVNPSTGLANGALQAVWGLNAVSGEWVSRQFGLVRYPQELTRVAPGRGYWINVSEASLLRLTNQPWQGPLLLEPGWNLVGLPGLSPESSGSSVEAFFRDRLPFVTQIWSWDSAPTRVRYVGLDAEAQPPLKELQRLVPGHAYWVYSKAPDVMELSSSLAITLPPDLDNPPLSTSTPRAPGAEDVGNDLNGNGILDDAYTQDTLRFPVGINTRLVTIVNDGYGRADWWASIPTAAPGQPSFVRFAVATPAVDAASIDPDLVSAQSGRSTATTTNVLYGSVASEPAHITVQVDRTGLVPGTYWSHFDVWAGTAQKTVQVIVEVPSVDGDWHGFAATRRVNGKPISIGKVDLHLAIYRAGSGTNASEASLRAIVSRERSLLFPRDVSMSGAFIGDHDFFLTSNFQVPRGDRNAPPFDRFHTGSDDHSRGQGFGDYDASGDGVLDNSNPFPFDLRREVSLLGVRLNENRLTGTYVESIQNVLPGTRRILIEGEFELERQSLAASLTSVFNRSSSTNAIIGGGGTSTFSTRFVVTNTFAVEGVSGQFNLDFGGGRDVAVMLTAPDGSAHKLLPATPGVSGSRSFAFADFNGKSGQGTWVLTVSWGGASERGNFVGWDLQLQGTATYNVSGVVAGGPIGSSVPLSGALVLLTGHGAVAQTFSDASGRFVFTNLTENDFTVFVSKPGFGTLRSDFDLFASSKDLGTLILQPLAPSTSNLAALPALGAQPLHVDFVPLLSAADLTALGTVTSNVWNFGHGGPVLIADAGTSSVAFVYTNAGHYEAFVDVYGTAGTRRLAQSVHVLPQRVLGQGLQVVSAGFVGSASGGAFGLTGRSVTAKLRFGEVTNLFTMLSATNLLESVRDPASFDFNRFDTRFGAIADGDTDVFQSSQNGFGTNGVFAVVDSGGGGDHVFTVNTNATRFRMICTMGGAVFAEGPARTGFQTSSGAYSNLVLQVGRLQP